MISKLIIDRSGPDAASAVGVTWIAFILAVPVFDADARSPFGIAAAALGGAVLIAIGFAAASRVRPLSTRAGAERLRLATRSLSLGAVMALVNLSINRGMASLDPTLERLLVERFAEIPTATSVLAAPVIEEIVFRLVLMSVVAVVVARFTANRSVVVWTALVVSAFVFGVIHVLRPEPERLELIWIYRTGVTIKSGIGGLLLGWIYWRWGLGYAIACHGTVNGVHARLEPLAFDM